MTAYDSWLSNSDDYEAFSAMPPRVPSYCFYCANEVHPASENLQCLACEVQGARDEYDCRLREGWPFSDIVEAHAEMVKWERIERRER